MTNKLENLRKLANEANKRWASQVFCNDENEWYAIGPIRKQSPIEETNPYSKAGQQAEMDSKYIEAARPQTTLVLLDAIEVMLGTLYNLNGSPLVLGIAEQEVRKALFRVEAILGEKK